MVVQEKQTSGIVQFYAGKTVLLTGATGAIGRIIMEKILRTCKDVEKIYLLVRPKKGKTPEQRLEELFVGSIMESMKIQNPKYREKVILISCDLKKSNCGLSEESIQILKNQVNIIVHCAATVRFDSNLRDATFINVRATKYLFELARNMVNLKVFLYVSTAFSFCNRNQIKEKFYSAPIQADVLIKLVETSDERLIDNITPILLEDWPNTYVFTKAVTEGLIAGSEYNFPVAIVRPSIVIATMSEPLPGWIDNIYGPSAIVGATSLGLMRTIHGEENNKADIVPADFVVNAILAAAYDTSRQGHNTYMRKPKSIYNYCSNPKSPLKWKTFAEYLFAVGHKGIVSPQAVWYPTFTIRKCVYNHYMAAFLQQTLPAFLVDVVLYLGGKQMRALGMMQRIDQITCILSYFVLREWDFRIDNTVQLWNGLNGVDQELFNFNMENFDWLKYIGVYLRGVGTYILKDPPVTTSANLKRLQRLMFTHYSVLVLFYILICYVIYIFFKTIVGLSD